MTIRKLTRSIGRLLGDDSGQDIVEYALLTAAICLVGIATWQSITNGIGTAYSGWDTNNQNLWEPPDPGGGS